MTASAFTRGAPLATYRLQFSASFTLADGRAFVPYLLPVALIVEVPT
jgi:maltooligosyltrehalose synthase